MSESETLRRSQGQSELPVDQGYATPYTWTELPEEYRLSQGDGIIRELPIGEFDHLRKAEIVYAAPILPIGAARVIPSKYDRCGIAVIDEEFRLRSYLDGITRGVPIGPKSTNRNSSSITATPHRGDRTWTELPEVLRLRNLHLDYFCFFSWLDKMKMKPARRGHGRKSKLKTSANKLSNKHLNKLGKQGKLKQEAHKKKLKQKRVEKARSKANEKTLHIHNVDGGISEEDDDFYRSKHLENSFLSTVKTRLLGSEDGQKSKKRKKMDAETDFNEEEYERLPRKLFSADGKKRMILPIKTQHGIVPQMVDEESEQEEDSIVTDVEPDFKDKMEVEREEPLPVLNGLDLYICRQRKLTERKEKMASLSSAIIANPEENMKKLRSLVSMLKEKDADVYVTVRKYAMVSLLEIFKDIIPGYYIRLPTEKEEQQKMKKETKTVMDYELALVSCYKEYLEFLDKTVKGPKSEEKYKKKGKIKPVNHLSIPQKSQQGLTELSVKCLCELLSTHPHFNYTNNIITVIVPYTNNRNSQISDMACDCVKKCFKEDKAGNVTLELTKCIGRMIKAREYRVQPKVLETFLSLKIKEVSYTDPLTKQDHSKDKKNYKLNDKLSRREKKKKKKMMFLEKDMQETKATEDKKMRLQLHTDTIQAVFLTYFRILKKATSSVLFPAVLEGLAKFAHLISVDFFDDLFTVFNKLIASEELTYRESLHCVQTAFTILSGQGAVLNIDPVVFYKHLYKNLFHVHAGMTSDDVPIILHCLDVMISKRKRQVSQQRVLAFIKRLATLSLQQTPAGMLGLLAAVRSCLLTYSYTDILLDNDSQGSGVYMAELDDPEHCHAHNASLWEFTLLQHHYDPAVRRMCNHLSHGSPTTGEGQLPAELRRHPVELFQTYEQCESFHPNIAQKVKQNKHKVQMRELLQEDFKQMVLSVLHSVKDTVNAT